YGPTRIKTPRLTAAAARGTVFLHNQSMAPSSPPSHSTIQTGVIPRVHGVTGDTGTIADGTPVLSAILSAAGLMTTYAGDNDFAMGRFRTIGHWDRFAAPIFAGGGKDCAPIIAEALKAAAAARDAHRRFFVSLLPIETHVPYRFHPGITEAYYSGTFGKPFGKQVSGHDLARIAGGSLAMDADRWAQLRAYHDGEVEHFDGCYGQLEDGLRAAGVLDRTAIVIASDHGEGLGERGGKVGHAYSLHRELVATPLVIVGGVPVTHVDVATSNLDLAATVLDLLGQPADPRMQGASLLPLTVEPVAIPRIVASEYGRSFALQATRWHLVVGYAGEASLHDVVADPEEVTDRSADAPIALRALRDAAGLYLSHRKEWHEASWGGLADLRPGNPLADPGVDRAHHPSALQSAP
ncbi:MAG TPA: sulfatase-like hydrolase/transferase, partial [Kofleriaceae bacterium]|nr:sulfatase-like hydrolase/transferase [Kofleriaceae bacterium]